MNIRGQIILRDLLITIMLTGLFFVMGLNFVALSIQPYNLTMDASLNATLFNASSYLLSDQSALAKEMQGSVEVPEGGLLTDLQQKTDIAGTFWRVITLPFSILKSAKIFIESIAAIFGLPDWVLITIEAILIIITALLMLSIYFGTKI